MSEVAKDGDRTIAVVGAGFLGKKVCQLLLQQNCPVFATNRHEMASLTRDPIDPQSTSLFQQAQLDLVAHDVLTIRNKLRGCSKIVICCAPGPSLDPKQDSKTSDRDQRRRELYIEGVQKIFQACEQLDIQRIVYTSSTSALPNLEGKLDESCQQWPLHTRGKIQREAEEAVKEQSERLNIPWIILRLAGLYGPGRELARIYRRAPEQILEGDGMQATNLIHRDDAARAIVSSLFLPNEIRGLIQVCDDDHCSRREMFQHVANAANLSPPRWQQEPNSNAPIRGKQVDNTRMKTILGLSLLYPFHSGEEGACE